jgi:hypothetical protein
LLSPATCGDVGCRLCRSGFLLRTGRALRRRARSAEGTALCSKTVADGERLRAVTINIKT